MKKMNEAWAVSRAEKGGGSFNPHRKYVCAVGQNTK